MMRRAALALALLASPALAQTGRADSADIDARTQNLRDEADIKALIVDYGRHLDALDFAAFAALFAEDGEWHGGGAQPAVGPAEIAARMEAGFGPDSGAVWTDDFHLVGNILVDLYPEGDADSAAATSRWVFVSPGPDAGAGRTVKPVLAGRYVDAFTRTPDGWRFASRRLVNDMAMQGFPAIRAEWETRAGQTD